MVRRDPAAVARFLERFAGDLVDAGIPRMPARVFVALLTSDDGSLTSTEIAERLDVSPGAVSGAVRYLIQVDLVRQERDPGSRRHRYRVLHDAWYEASMHREPMLARWRRSIADGLDALGPETPAGRRLSETHDFIAFLEVETPAMLERWRRQRA